LASYDLVVLGGGVMGRFTAHHAAERGARVVILERGRVGDPLTASYGRTRSFRNDYLDTGYALLAHEAYRRWGEFEARTGTEVLVRCGGMNIAKRSITPDLAGTYAEMSHAVLQEAGLETVALDGDDVRRRFPFLDADLGRLEFDAGVVNLPAVTDALTRVLDERGVRTLEGVETTAVERGGEALRVITDAGEFVTRALVVTAGHGTNALLARLPGCELEIPLSRDRPSEAKYVTPPAHTRAQFTAGAMPVIAYLDTGIYCHPIVEGLTDAVKIGYYNPPDMPRGTTGVDSIAAFIEQCMPGLAGAEMHDVEDVDQCDYDLVADDDFVLGAVPGVANAFVGVGWRGTGYKFAPWVGRVLAGLALGDGTGNDIDRFDPARFLEGGSPDGPAITADPAAAPR
jgi:sarcosine oxidase